MHYKTLISGVLLLALSFSVQAGIETVLHEEKIQWCTLRITHDAVPGKKGVIVMRQDLRSKVPCSITAEEAVKPLGIAMRKFRANKSLADVTSIFLPDNLYNYKWLYNHLWQTGLKDPSWDRKTGKPVRGTENAWVNKVLFNEKLMMPLNKVLAPFHYRISGVHCEKVLISQQHRIPSSATCWLKLEKVKQTPAETKPSVRN